MMISRKYFKIFFAPRIAAKCKGDLLSLVLAFTASKTTLVSLSTLNKTARQVSSLVAAEAMCTGVCKSQNN